MSAGRPHFERHPRNTGGKFSDAGTRTSEAPLEAGPFDANGSTETMPRATRPPRVINFSYKTQIDFDGSPFYHSCRSCDVPVTLRIPCVLGRFTKWRAMWRSKYHMKCRLILTIHWLTTLVPSCGSLVTLRFLCILGRSGGCGAHWTQASPLPFFIKFP